MVLYYCVLKRTKGGKGRTFLFPGCIVRVISLCMMKEDVKGWYLESHGHERKSQGMKKNGRVKWGNKIRLLYGNDYGWKGVEVGVIAEDEKEGVETSGGLDIGRRECQMKRRIVALGGIKEEEGK